jgi:outer membrane protein OmpA-like peptidoglycan-associated protein
MESNDRLRQPLILLLLLIAGAGIIWYVGHDAAAQPSIKPIAHAKTIPAQKTEIAGERPSVVASAVTNAGAPGKDFGTEAASKKAAEEKPKVSAKEKDVSSSLKKLALRSSAPRMLNTQSGRQVVGDPILFNTGNAELRQTSIEPLNKLAAILKEMPDLQLEIIGFTDNLGVEPVNEKLSADRAAAVKEYLVSRGVEASRLTAKGLGSQQPAASNATKLGRQANRRIEFLVTSPK